MNRVLRRFVHTNNRKLRDVVVIGGGPAGLSILVAMKSIPALQHLRVSLIESQPISQKLMNWSDTKHDQEKFDNRVISLTPQSVSFLDKIGSWQNVRHDRVLPYDEMRVWDGESNSSIEFDGWSSESGVIASMIEISNLQQALYLTNTAKDHIIESPVSKFSRNPENGWPVIHLSNGEEIETRLLIGADGQQSPVRNFAEVETRGWDYNRFGVVGTLQLEYDDFRTVAYQRFLRTGPLAILPLPEDKATMVWSTLPDRAQWLKKLDPKALAAVINAGLRLEMVDIDYLHTIDPANTDEILEEVQWRLEERLSNSTSEDQLTEDEQLLPVMVEDVVEGSVAAFPLKMRHADSYIGDRVALVGDAAHTTHPLSGQGLNMGQRDVQALISAMETATARGLDIGSPLALEPYPRETYTQNHVILGVNDKLHKLYSTDSWPVVKLRSFGLDLVDSLPFIKKFAMKQAQ